MSSLKQIEANRRNPKGHRTNDQKELQCLAEIVVAALENSGVSRSKIL